VKTAASITLLTLVWELIGRARIYPQYILPSFSEVACSFIDPEYLHILLENTALTMLRAGLGFLLGSLVGIVLGFIIVGLKLEEYVQPVASILFTIPTVALVPLLILWVGLDPIVLPVTTSFICSFPPILYGVLNAKRTVDLDLVEVALTLGADTWTTLIRVVAPISLLKIAPIIKTEAIMVFKTTLVVEMLALTSGLGHLLLMYSITIDVKHLLSTIIALSMIMAAIVETIDVAEKRVASKWIGERPW
jgi:NitT/TauT family transport system permease protein